jgi:hypothetical protein
MSQKESWTTCMSFSSNDNSDCYINSWEGDYPKFVKITKGKLMIKDILTIEDVKIKWVDSILLCGKYQYKMYYIQSNFGFVNKDGTIFHSLDVEEDNRVNFYFNSLPDALKAVIKYLEKRPKTVEEKFALISKIFYDHVNDVKMRCPNNIVNGDYKFENRRLQEIYDILKND